MQLEYYTVVAPISGRVGVVGMKEGNIAKAGDNSAAGVFATINQISPIYVAFSITQTLLPALREAMERGADVVATPQGSTFESKGKLAIIDNAVDANTGTIVARAIFANADERLWPGQLCDLTLTLRVEPNTVVVPREAILIGQDGNYVFTVAEGVAHVRPVEVGRTESNETVVTKGLERRRDGGGRRLVDAHRRLQGRSARSAQEGKLMSLPELCIRRPVMTSLLMLSFIVFGLFGYKQLPVSALPRVDFPTIAVNTSLPGASADTMASSVAGPLERAFATIPGINMMTSSSTLGNTQIVMQFDLERNIDGAALDVQSNISATLRKLPPQLPAPPSFQKLNPADSPILFIALVSKTLPLTQVDDYAEEVFADQISQISGVSQVLVFGQQKFAVRVAVDPDAAAARGLTLDNVGNAVAAANSSTPVGALLGKRQNVTVDATGQMEHAKLYENLVVSWHNGSPVRLKEIAHVYDSVLNKQIAGWYGAERAIVLAVFRQSDANTVDVVDNVRAKIPYYSSQLPPSVQTVVANDRSISIRQSIDDVQKTLLISIALVVIVIFVFLKSGAATLIPALALPVSLVGACAFLYVFNYSIDNISLLAITLSVGFVVDDAIVMLENITRHIEGGEKPFDAALKGSQEIAFTILSITFSLVAVFIPVLLMGGVVGRVFHEFAVTITVAILVSGFVSLTLTPMLCARILSAPKHGREAGWLSRLSDLVVNSLLAGYRVSLDFVLKFRFEMLLVTFATIGLSVYMYATIPKGFFPDEDTGFLRGVTETQPDTSFREMSARQVTVNQVLSQDPAVEYVTSAVGFGGATNKGFLFVKLKDKDKRESMYAIMARMRVATAAIPGIRTIMQPVQNSRVQRRPHCASQVPVHSAVRRHRHALQDVADHGARDG